MANFKNIGDISLSETEYCFLVGNQFYYNNYFTIRIPKLMPKVTAPQVEIFNRNIFVNDITCKPVIANTLNVQNYITIPRSSQCSLFDKANAEFIVPSGTGVTCSCTNGNYKNMKITDYT